VGYRRLGRIRRQVYQMAPIRIRAGGRCAGKKRRFPVGGTGRFDTIMIPCYS
jgi:hypothetical protein